jgi:guanylate kinase
LPEAVSIFVLPPDRKTLEWRLRKRSEDANAVIQRRLVAASREIENYDKYDYILINDELEESIDRLQAIVAWRAPAAIWAAARSCPRRIRRIVELADRCRLANIRDRVSRSCVLSRTSDFGTLLDFAVSF